MSAKERTFATALWDFFCSLKLTIITLILLAISSIIGTVIQQNRSPEEYLQYYGETTYKIFETLQFFDMYHSWWFLALLGLFSLNLICCSIKRFPRVWKTVTVPVLTADETLFRTLSNAEEQVVRDEIAPLKEKLQGFLTREFAPVTVTEENGKVHLYAQKGAYSRFGVYVTHLSILIIFVGAIMGSLWGYKAYVNIVEGSEVHQVWPRGGKEPIDLGFSVRCDAFSVSYYEGSMRPREFRSLLTVVDAGQPVEGLIERPVIVNDPLQYKGITFYQSSYGPAGDASFSFRVRSRKSGETANVVARQGQRVRLPDNGFMRVVDYDDSDPRFGLGARVEIVTAEGKRRNANIFKEFPAFDERRGGDYIFTLNDFSQRYYTGLQVAKDPGVWVVWLGCALMVVGSFIAFFMSHRRVWVVIQPLENGKTGVRFGGSAHRNQPAFEIFFDEFKKNLKKEIAS
ncbi:MAG: cytochrome c biogenesis protein ResB [Desulfuromonas sp.]|nr:MAG: cytochrome c biogenesis protein ResB [Desulfuromonas sp.]